jgi:predicted GIY-YIG superfamily endonuclease
VTNNLVRRVYKHREKLLKGFTEKYNVSSITSNLERLGWRSSASGD